MNFIFIHGGPGLNTNPEKHLFKSSFFEGDNVLFWNEPSAIRNDFKTPVTFKDSLDSLQQAIQSFSPEKVTVIAHSFGAFLLNEILPLVEDHLERIILLAPVSHVALLDKKLIEVVASSDPVLETYLQNYDDTISFDSDRFSHLLLAVSKDGHALQYWHKKGLIENYFSFMQEAPFQFVLENFKSIRETCDQLQVRRMTHVPTDIIYGANDPFVSFTEQTLMQSLYLNSKVHVFEDSAHYAHVEEQERFERIVHAHKISRQITNNDLQLDRV